MIATEIKLNRTPFTPEVQHAFEDGVTAVIPVDYLWSRQDPKEYSSRHARRVREALKNNGTEFLAEHPIWAVLVREATGARLIITDGHHRSRFAPVYGIHKIHTKIIAVELLAKVTGQKPEELTTQYLNQANIADSRLADTRAYKFRPSRTLSTNGWVWTPLGVAEHFSAHQSQLSQPIKVPVTTNTTYIIFGNGNRSTPEPHSTGEIR